MLVNGPSGIAQRCSPGAVVGDEPVIREEHVDAVRARRRGSAMPGCSACRRPGSSPLARPIPDHPSGRAVDGQRHQPPAAKARQIDPIVEQDRRGMSLRHRQPPQLIARRDRTRSERRWRKTRRNRSARGTATSPAAPRGRLGAAATATPRPPPRPAPRGDGGGVGRRLLQRERSSRRSPAPRPACRPWFQV